MRTKEELPACPVATTVSLIGSKWKLLILRNLMDRPWRFNELKRDLDGISQKVLTDSLRSMEADGLIVRTVYAEVPPRVEYSLSALGRSIQPVMDGHAGLGPRLQERHPARRSGRRPAGRRGRMMRRKRLFQKGRGRAVLNSSVVLQTHVLQSCKNFSYSSYIYKSNYNIKTGIERQAMPRVPLAVHGALRVNPERMIKRTDWGSISPPAAADRAYAGTA